MGIYLDYNASTPVDPRVFSVMEEVYCNHFGNADSRTHDFGEDVRLITEKARLQVSTMLGVQKNEVFFTSGATESNNIAILGLQRYGEQNGKKHIIISAIEHKAVRGAAQHLEEFGFDVEQVFPDESGCVRANDVLSKVRADTLLVSVMHVNNETGIIQPVKEIGDNLSKRNVMFHIDATQSCGKLVEEIKQLQYSFMSISSHKMHGPQGIGALIIKRKRYKMPPISPVFFGGGQEGGIRPGTLPTALIAGFGEACEIASKEWKQRNERCRMIKDYLLTLLEQSGVKYYINGDPERCISTTLNVSFPGLVSEALMIASKQFCGVSNGSACTSGDYSYSYVLSAMKLPESRIESAIRISWGPDIDQDVLGEEFCNLLQTVRMFVSY